MITNEKLRDYRNQIIQLIESKKGVKLTSTNLVKVFSGDQEIKIHLLDDVLIIASRTPRAYFDQLVDSRSTIDPDLEYPQSFEAHYPAEGFAKAVINTVSYDVLKRDTQFGIATIFSEFYKENVKDTLEHPEFVRKLGYVAQDVLDALEKNEITYYPSIREAIIGEGRKHMNYSKPVLSKAN